MAKGDFLRFFNSLNVAIDEQNLFFNSMIILKSGIVNFYKCNPELLCEDYQVFLKVYENKTLNNVLPLNKQQVDEAKKIVLMLNKTQKFLEIYIAYYIYKREFLEKGYNRNTIKDFDAKNDIIMTVTTLIANLNEFRKEIDRIEFAKNFLIENTNLYNFKPEDVTQSILNNKRILIDIKPMLQSQKQQYEKLFCKREMDNQIVKYYEKTLQ